MVSRRRRKWVPKICSVPYHSCPRIAAGTDIAGGGGGIKLNVNRVRCCSPFSSTREGKLELWKQSLGTGEAIRITQLPAFDAIEFPDGRLVFETGKGLWQIPFIGGPEKPAPEFAGVECARYCAASRHAFYFVDHQAPPRMLKAFSFASRRTRDIGLIEKDLITGTPSLTVSPDDRWLLYAQKDRINSNVMLSATNLR